ncbi:hypothetical protein AB0A69_24020 [Streptomyces sp. NPDC045431]|uniref:hypothetical protein n=1 Tax=Streptomyces sp. NPDC045431 TaxID=3155613 RepID=UPI0033D37319
MRVSRHLITGACAGVLAVGAAFSAPAAAAPASAPAALHTPQPAPTPSPTYRVGEAITSVKGLPFCGLRQGNAFVIIDQGRAIVVDGTGHFVQAILKPGESNREYKVTFHKDGKRVTYTPDGAAKPVTEVCKPLK